MKNTIYLDQQTFLSAPVLDTSLALEVTEVTDCAAVKAKLVSLYGDKASATVNGKSVAIGKLGLFDAVSVPAQPDYAKAKYNAADVVRVIARLARDGDGCPWDRAQTHESIRVNMIEEAYEAVDAIDKHDNVGMCEEFGDVLLQSVLQSDIARRSGEFDFADVCDGLCKKLISRHTFIFGADSAANADEALGLWEKAKGIEKHYDTVKSQLTKLPDTFPSLLYAQKAYKKMKKAGMTVDCVASLDAALKAGDYVSAIEACVGLLADQGKDAEVELNKHVKSKIDKL